VSSTPGAAATNGKLITVAGIDGAGKSTLAAALCEKLNDAGQDTILAGKRTVDVPSSEDLSQYLDAVNAVVYRRKASVAQACGDRYWLFALAAWYSLQDELIVRPALQAGTHVILDNAHHKILARYAVNPEVPAEAARPVFAHLTAPDMVLFLRITAHEALRRKRGFTAVEAGHTGPSQAHFITYQDKVTDELSRQQTGETWAPIDVTSKSPDAVLRAALAALAERGVLSLAGHGA
jgi:thymidylate kinase